MKTLAVSLVALFSSSALADDLSPLSMGQWAAAGAMAVARPNGQPDAVRGMPQGGSAVYNGTWAGEILAAHRSAGKPGYIDNPDCCGINWNGTSKWNGVTQLSADFKSKSLSAHFTDPQWGGVDLSGTAAIVGNSFTLPSLNGQVGGYTMPHVIDPSCNCGPNVASGQGTFATGAASASGSFKANGFGTHPLTFSATFSAKR